VAPTSAYLSTDYVFDGRATRRFYKDGEQPNPTLCLSTAGPSWRERTDAHKEHAVVRPRGVCGRIGANVVHRQCYDWRAEEARCDSGPNPALGYRAPTFDAD